MIFALVLCISSAAFVHGGEPIVNCPAPRSPDHGQSFVYEDGRLVKYVCEPGFVLVGSAMMRCLAGKWEAETPLCVENDAADVNDLPLPKPGDLEPPPPSRPLFNWGGETEQVEEANDTSSEEKPMSDEARLQMVLYPRRQARLRAAVLRSASQLEEEEKKRSEGGSSTTVRVQSPPSVVYVRRTVSPSKSDTLTQQYRTASVHLTEDDGKKDQVEVVTMPRAAATQNDKGDDVLRHQYWMANYYYPRSASYVDYRTGAPVAMTLSESQIAWINSLHPELRDQYLRDLYVQRADESLEGARAQAFLRRYDDAYNWYHSNYYYRQPVSMAIHDEVSIYDYSCNQAGSSFVRAPKLPNAHIARYDRRQNSNEPRQHYLAAVYRCNPGFIMLDTRFTELYCSRRSWIGTGPRCVPRS